MFPRVYQEKEEEEEEGEAVLYNRQIQTFCQKTMQKFVCRGMHVLYVDVVCVWVRLYAVVDTLCASVHI